VAHVWAHKLQAEARTPGNGNLSFSGDTIYSYGSHFPIARHVTTKQGKAAVLFTTRTYSATTAKHCREVAGSLRGLDIPVFKVHDVNGEPNSNFDGLEVEFRHTLELAAKARSGKDMRLADAEAEMNNANAYAEAFGYRRRLKMPGDLQEIKEAVNRAQAKARKEQKIRDDKIREERSELLSKWAGVHLVWKRGFEYCRLSGDKSQVETTKQAMVEVPFVKRALRTVLKLYATGATYKRNGERIPVGPYVLDSVDQDGTIKVGCHVFEKPEVLRLAELLK
jgi:hypothetical protein